MRLFIDECMSPKLVSAIFAFGHYAEHPRDVGIRGATDYDVLARCLGRDLTVVTHNARDFRKLVGRTDLHPGLIIMEEAEFAISLQLIKAVIDYVEHASGTERPDGYMINRVIEIDITGKIKDYLLP
jgi:predicted nuclease of predicted toxin-antitoxin system